MFYWIAQRSAKNGCSWLSEDGHTKCYRPWDDVIHQVLEYGRDKLKLDMAYARLGEDLADADFDQGQNIYIGYHRQLDTRTDFPNGDKL